jgi:hypothetical protein
LSLHEFVSRTLIARQAAIFHETKDRNYRFWPHGHLHSQRTMRSELPLSVTIFEVEADAGKGTPYHPDINDQAMLANIASIELPAISAGNAVRRSPQSA